MQICRDRTRGKPMITYPNSTRTEIARGQRRLDFSLHWLATKNVLYIQLEFDSKEGNNGKPDIRELTEGIPFYPGLLMSAN
jgi:hypothetical protein